MKYKVIFTTGYDDDIDSLARGLRADILICDENGDYYQPRFISLERINLVFDENRNCYLEDNLVILHSVTKETILNVIPELYKWKFFEYWKPLTTTHVKKYFYPEEDWIIFIIEAE